MIRDQLEKKKWLDELVAENCSRALRECKDYMEKEYSGNYSDEELWLESQKIIYKRAVQDTIKTLLYFDIIST